MFVIFYNCCEILVRNFVSDRSAFLVTRTKKKKTYRTGTKNKSVMLQTDHFYCSFLHVMTSPSAINRSQCCIGNRFFKNIAINKAWAMMQKGSLNNHLACNTLSALFAFAAMSHGLRQTFVIRMCNWRRYSNFLAEHFLIWIWWRLKKVKLEFFLT